MYIMYVQFTIVIKDFKYVQGVPKYSRIRNYFGICFTALVV